MKKLIALLLPVIFIASCSMEEGSDQVADSLDTEFFTEFMPFRNHSCHIF